MSSNIVKIDKFRKKAKSRVGFLSFLLVITIMCFFLTSPIFAIECINVSGNKNISEEEIISASGIIYGQNIMKIDKFSIKEEISKMPYVKNIVIKRNWPNQVNMVIEEKKSVAEVPFYGSKVLIDEEGYILEVITDNATTDFVVIEGISVSGITTGTKLECDKKEILESYLEMLKIFNNNDMLSKVRKLTILNEEYLIHLEDGHVAKIGDNIDNLQYKILLLKEIIERETNAAYIDLSNLDMIVTKPVWGMFDTEQTINNSSSRGEAVEE